MKRLYIYLFVLFAFGCSGTQPLKEPCKEPKIHTSGGTINGVGFTAEQLNIREQWIYDECMKRQNSN